VAYPFRATAVPGATPISAVIPDRPAGERGVPAARPAGHGVELKGDVAVSIVDPELAETQTS